MKQTDVSWTRLGKLLLSGLVLLTVVYDVRLVRLLIKTLRPSTINDATISAWLFVDIRNVRINLLLLSCAALLLLQFLRKHLSKVCYSFFFLPIALGFALLIIETLMRW